MKQFISLFAGVTLALLFSSGVFAGTTVSFSGTVTSVTEDLGYFEPPWPIDIGSTVEGVITYSSIPDHIYDPEPEDCTLGHIFPTGTIILSIERSIWEYQGLGVLVSDCIAQDLVHFLAQAAVSYPSTAPAHQLELKLFDQIEPFTLVHDMELPRSNSDLAIDEITRMTGRIVNFTWGDIRFDVDSVSIDGVVPVEQQTWGQVKALYAR